MESSTLITLVTIVVTWVLGIIAKKSIWFNTNLIPIQNITIGVVVACIEWIITKDFNIAIATSGLIAGGTYDIIHNLKKIFKNRK